MLLVFSVTPRAAQRQREIDASPTQLSPASPVTEEEASSVLLRVNSAVSSVNWDQEARTPLAAARQHSMAQQLPFGTPMPTARENTISQQQRFAREHTTPHDARIQALATEREAIFNTPLPRGARAAVRRAPAEVAEAMLEGLRPRPEDPSGFNARLVELALRQVSRARTHTHTAHTHSLRVHMQKNLCFYVCVWCVCQLGFWRCENTSGVPHQCGC